MKKFEATTYNAGMIVLADKSKLEELYDTIESEEDFILEWDHDGKEMTEIIIANNLSSKVKNGEVKLISFDSEEK